MVGQQEETKERNEVDAHVAEVDVEGARSEAGTWHDEESPIYVRDCFREGLEREIAERDRAVGQRSAIAPFDVTETV